MATAALAIQPQTIQAQAFSLDLFDRFIDYTDCKESTVKGYITCLRHFVRWINENGITQPQRDDIKAYKAALAVSGLAAGTQAQYLRAAKHFFKWTAAEGLYPNIADNIKGVKIRHDIHKKDALERDAVAKIADTIDRSAETGKRDYAIYMLAITCGLRCVEIHRADVGDITTEGDRTYLYVQGKGHDEKDAPVLIVPAVKEAITDYMNARADKITAKSPLFVSTSNRSKGERIAPTTISTLIKRILVNAGYDSSRLTAHSLRHTSATGCYRATGDLLLTKDQCRHADVSTTQVYSHELERAERITEQQVYNYYFASDNTQAQRETAERLLEQMNGDKLERAIEFLKTIQ